MVEVEVMNRIREPTKSNIFKLREFRNSLLFCKKD